MTDCPTGAKQTSEISLIFCIIRSCILLLSHITLCCPALHNNLIEDGVTDAEDVHDDRVLQQRQQVVWHSLPEMKQEVLDLEQSIEEFDQSG